MMKRIFLSPPYLCGAEETFVREAFEENWIAPAGPHLQGFEDAVCRYTGAQYAVALASGTAAIHLALKYVGVGEGDVVFCSDMTFSGSCNPILYEKATPVFIDAAAGTCNMSATALAAALEDAKKKNRLPKAVVIVDLYGMSADFDRLLPICAAYGIPVIEDAAEALGAQYHGKACGTFGKIGVYSFNGNKIVTTSGGGMAVSNEQAAIDKIKFWANQAKENVPYYYHKELGYNYRMSNICAGIGRGQMTILKEKIEKRKQIHRFYRTALQGLPIRFMEIPEDTAPNYWLTVLFVDPASGVAPTQVVDALAQENIESRRAWNPMHAQPFFSEFPYVTDGESVSQRIFDTGVCMPSGEAMTEEDLERVTSVVKALF